MVDPVSDLGHVVSRNIEPEVSTSMNSRALQCNSNTLQQEQQHIATHCSSRNSNRTNQSKKLHCGDALSLSGERSRIMGNWRIAANSSLIGSSATYRRFFGSNISLVGSSLRHSEQVETRFSLWSSPVTLAGSQI